VVYVRVRLLLGVGNVIPATATAAAAAAAVVAFWFDPNIERLMSSEVRRSEDRWCEMIILCISKYIIVLFFSNVFLM